MSDLGRRSPTAYSPASNSDFGRPDCLMMLASVHAEVHRGEEPESYSRVSNSSLHDPVAAPLADSIESIAVKNLANLRARKDSKPTQSEPLPG